MRASSCFDFSVRPFWPTQFRAFKPQLEKLTPFSIRNRFLVNKLVYGISLQRFYWGERIPQILGNSVVPITHALDTRPCFNLFTNAHTHTQWRETIKIWIHWESNWWNESWDTLSSDWIPWSHFSCTTGNEWYCHSEYKFRVGYCPITYTDEVRSLINCASIVCV